MSGRAVEHFADELDRIVRRARFEYDLTYAEVVGTLQMKAWLLCDEASDQTEPEDDEESPDER